MDTVLYTKHQTRHQNPGYTNNYVFVFKHPINKRVCEFNRQFSKKRNTNDQ